MNPIIDRTIHERRVTTELSELDIVALIQKNISERTGMPIDGKTKHHIWFEKKDRGTYFEFVGHVEIWNDLTPKG